MADKIDMSLDDIIKSGKKRGGGPSASGKRRGTFRSTQRARGGVQRGINRGGIRRPYTRGDVNTAWKRTFNEAKKSVSVVRDTSRSGHTKLLVTNLDFGVIDSDMQDLFVEFGSLKNAVVHYDQSGRSRGTADVTFERKDDAIKAMKHYNGVPLDGRPMIIQLATSDITSVLKGGRLDDGVDRKPSGKGRGKLSRGGRQPQKKSTTAKELDDELDAYTEEMKK